MSPQMGHRPRNVHPNPPQPGLLAKENHVVCEPSLGMGKARAGILLRVTIPAHLEELEGSGKPAGKPPRPSGERNAATATKHLSPLPCHLPQGWLFPM